MIISKTPRSTEDTSSVIDQSRCDSPFSLCSVDTSTTLLSNENYTFLSDDNVLQKNDDNTTITTLFLNNNLSKQTCVLQHQKPKRKRLVTLLTVIIMILLSITIGVTWKHFELIKNMKSGKLWTRNGNYVLDVK